MGRPYFQYEITPKGIELRLVEKRWTGRLEALPTDGWIDRTENLSFSGLSRVLALADDIDSPVERRSESLFLDHSTVASLSEPQALGLGLPPSMRFVLQISTRNLITDRDFNVSYRWIDEANRSIRSSRIGAFVQAGADRYRLPQPSFSLVEAIDQFAASDAGDDGSRMEHLAQMQTFFPQEEIEQLSIDKYFFNFRILHASAFSLSLRVKNGAFEFDPILFGRRVLDRSIRAEDASEEISEAESILTEHQQSIFADERFRATPSVKPSYLIERGVYLYLDPALQAAMTIVHRMQRGDAETRKRFVQSPQLYLKEALGENLADDEVERIFVETEQYSARVTGVGIWVPPVLPWIKRESNSWLPEKFGLQIGGQYVELKPEEVAVLRDSINEARSKGEEYVEFGDQNIRIPANDETEKSLSELLGAIEPFPNSATGTRDAVEPIERVDEGKHVLLVEENFDKLGFVRKASPRPGRDLAVPVAIRPTLMKHQLKGLHWMQQSWMHGSAGALLADDMGLGKTLQMLALILHARATGERRPFLVVAPTSVLATWHDEAARFAPDLAVRIVDATTAKTGERVTDAAAGADIVVTSYAILRLDEDAFTASEWAALVLDEAQFVKNPQTKLHRIALGIRADVTIAITGTPMENSLGELWALLALTAPGLFPSSRLFREQYIQPIEQGKVPENQEGTPFRAARLERLRRRIRPLVLRRTKESVAPELPPKQEQEVRVELSPAHRAIYDAVLQRERQKVLGLLDDLDRNRFIVFRSLTLLRMLSLAPGLVDPRDARVPSAKLDALVEQLTEMAAEGHRALVFSQFTSFLDLAEARLDAAGIAHLRLDGSTRRRSAVVSAFRDGEAPVFLVSLKAGGFGLTLTEADYVFLLDPWWNPAAEAQAIDRTHRIGQDRSVMVYRMIAADTIEEKVLALQQRKARLFRAVMDDDELFARALDADDIRALLDG